MPRRNIKEVLKRHTAELMEVPGVAGIAEGESQGKPCIKVFVLGNNSEFLGRIPSTLEGYPVQVEESGEFRAFTI
ncbi:hypothetical protein ACFLTP_09410 [Chloroflexota bacterium]